MGTLTEDALAQAVEADTLQTGEMVMVVTKMGNPVSTGVVQAVYPYGAVQLREITDPRSAAGSRIYDSAIYSFILIKDDATTIDPDEFSIDRNAQSVSEEDGKEDGKEKGKEAEKPEDKPAPEPPPEKTTGALKDAQVERVLAAVSEAAIQSMRSSGVSNTEIYKKVVALQDAILPVLKKPEV